MCIHVQIHHLAPGLACVEENGASCIEVQHLQQTQRYSDVQLLSMLLHHLHATAEKEHGSPLPECAIAVPLSYGAVQRQAVLDAAAVAGFTCLQLVLDVSSHVQHTASRSL